MTRAIVTMVGVLAGSALVIAGLSVWHSADDWALDWVASRPELAAWAVRSAGIGMVAAAQAIFIPTVVWTFYRRGQADTVLAAGAAGLVALSCAAAVAFNFAGR